MNLTQFRHQKKREAGKKTSLSFETSSPTQCHTLKHQRVPQNFALYIFWPWRGGNPWSCSCRPREMIHSKKLLYKINKPLLTGSKTWTSKLWNLSNFVELYVESDPFGGLIEACMLQYKVVQHVVHYILLTSKQKFSHSTVIGARMSYWKWRETTLQPSRARSGHQISCCLVSLHFLCDILAPITV